MSDAALWRKHSEGLFNESIETMRQTRRTDAPDFDAVELPESPNRAFADAWRAVLA